MNMKLLAILASALLVSGAVRADTLLIEKLDEPEAVEMRRPVRGMTMTGVESTFGAPVARRAAVGDPPITRWEYSDYTVFFEYDRVIHTVDKPSS